MSDMNWLPNVIRKLKRPERSRSGGIRVHPCEPVVEIKCRTFSPGRRARVSRGGEFFPFGRAGFTEISEPALFDRAVLELEGELRRPARLGFNHVLHDARRAREPVDHEFAEIAFAGGRDFGFAHAPR